MESRPDRVYSDELGHRECFLEIRRFPANAVDPATPAGKVVIADYSCGGNTHVWDADKLKAAIDFALTTVVPTESPHST